MVGPRPPLTSPVRPPLPLLKPGRLLVGADSPVLEVLGPLSHLLDLVLKLLIVALNGSGAVAAEQA